MSKDSWSGEYAPSTVESPMIKRLSVKNFKSIRDLDIEMRPLMVLVGPNGAGKSNFLSVFRFARDQNEVIGAVDGYKNLVWNGREDLAIGVEVRGERPMQRAGNAHFDFRMEYGGSPFRASLSPGLGDLANGWAFYRFSANTMRPVRQVLQEGRLNEDGSNLSSVLHSLHSAEDPAYDDIEALFKVFVPEAESLISPLHGSGTYVAFRQKGLHIPIRTSSMSDGTLFGLALIVALFAPDRPSLICIEAPDIELHPYLMQHVAELLRTASQTAQIIITTHSPFLLDYLPPESIAIVEKTNGETSIRWAEDKRGVKQAIKLLGAGEAWRAGHLGGVPA